MCAVVDTGLQASGNCLGPFSEYHRSPEVAFIILAADVFVVGMLTGGFDKTSKTRDLVVNESILCV